jgi:hypothetical protein
MGERTPSKGAVVSFRTPRPSTYQDQRPINSKPVMGGFLSTSEETGQHHAQLYTALYTVDFEDEQGTRKALI